MKHVASARSEAILIILPCSGRRLQERSEEKDGRVTTETKKHEHHEEVEDEEVPDDAGREPSDTSSVHEITKETRNHYTTVKDEDQV